MKLLEIAISHSGYLIVDLASTTNNVKRTGWALEKAQFLCVNIIFLYTLNNSGSVSLFCFHGFP